MNNAEILKEKLQSGFPHAVVIRIEDTIGDGNHFAIYIKDSIFEGLSKLAQHKLVYQKLGDIVGTKIHALSVKTEV